MYTWDLTLTMLKVPEVTSRLCSRSTSEQPTMSVKKDKGLSSKSLRLRELASTISRTKTEAEDDVLVHLKRSLRSANGA